MKAHGREEILDPQLDDPDGDQNTSRSRPWTESPLFAWVAAAFIALAMKFAKRD